MDGKRRRGTRYTYILYLSPSHGWLHQKQIEAFRDFLEVLPHPTKVVVAGNHDLTFHESYYETIGTSLPP